MAVKRFRKSQGRRGLNGLPPGPSELLLVRRPGQEQHILRLLRLHDVQDVVEGDSTQEDPELVHHGNGDQVVAGDEAPYFLLVFGGQDRGDHRLHQLGHRLKRIGENEIRQANRSEEVVVFVHHEHGIELLHFPALPPHLGDGLACREGPVDPNEMGVHQPPGGFLVVPKEAADLPGLLQGEGRQDPGPVLRLQLPHKVYGIVVVQLLEKRGPPLGIHGRQKVGRVLLLVHLRQSLGRQLGRKGLHEGDPLLLGLQSLHQIRHVAGVKLLQERTHVPHSPGRNQLL